MHTSLVASAALAGLAGTAAAASVASAYTDPNTGIDFQTYFSSSVDYSFGLALPETVESDFIGQLVVPLTDSAGWGGVSFGSGMLNHLLLVAWADGDDVVSSFREATAYSNPPVYSNSSVSALPIANGTFVNSTHVSYTFLCKGCILGGSTTFTATAEDAALAYAVASTSPSTISDSTSALTYHDSGFGDFSVVTADAKSSDVATWASWASASTGTGGSNSTSPGGGSNSTVIPTTSNVTYDVIVVGGGPAGIIAAERLAETGASVLLIERGPANTVALGSKEGLSWNSSLTPYDVPALGSSLVSVSGVKLCSDTASTAGCLLGGSSSINGENFIHPPEHDFERWPAGWSWSDVSAAADRLYARNPGTTQPSADGVYYDELAFKVVSAYLDAEGWNQVDSIESPNEKHQVYSRPAWSIKDHLRAGPARTYMPYAEELDNFTLQLNTKVIQVKRTGSNVTGVLVELEDDSQQIINLNAGGKVVIAAGALSTPRVLWNSGIGRSDALEIVKSGTTGVELPDETDWIDLPVGHNLMDHSQLPLQFTTTTNFTAYNFLGIDTDPVASDLALYYQGSGVITQAAQRLHMWTSANGTDGRTRYFQGTISAMTSDTVTAKVFLTHGTTSTGELGIDSSGNTVLSVKPWLVEDADREAFSDFLQWWLDITNGTVSVSSNDTMTITPAGSTPSSLISSSLVSGDHWVGSAKMGTDDGRDNGTSVVDLNTKVYGTDNLFVVDASIHPDLPTGNTQAIIMVVAEQAAQKIANYTVTST
ncbi:Cellobiose dehydrogenase [Cytospora mali]|uniref:Cellobiose dehydrogenase n=1 Tax=Cytospora mali TaxID=578113 RepID=A0A194UUM1_CYTMA|nr:Cellobiose dehydrogenase [Valsa mali var. pyri (nom. inval.)]